MIEELDEQYALSRWAGFDQCFCREVRGRLLTAEEIRSGGAHSIDGKVDKNGGSLLATINKNIATLAELQPEVSAGLATEIRSIMETTGDKVTSELKESIAGEKR